MNSDIIVIAIGILLDQTISLEKIYEMFDLQGKMIEGIKDCGDLLGDAGSQVLFVFVFI